MIKKMAIPAIIGMNILYRFKLMLQVPGFLQLGP